MNLLERRVAPGLAGETKRISAILEEREREEQLRMGPKRVFHVR